MSDAKDSFLSPVLLEITWFPPLKGLSNDDNGFSLYLFETAG